MNNSEKHHINTFQFELLQLSSVSRHLIEDNIVKIFDASLKRIVEKYGSRYTPSDKEILLDRLELDLGELYQQDLEKQLPRAFEKALQDQLLLHLKNPEKHQIISENEGMASSSVHPLFHYLMHGLYPWYYSKKQSFLTLWNRELAHKSFIQQSFSRTWGTNEITRLSVLLDHPSWKKTLRAFTPRQAAFILEYQAHVSGIYKRERFQHPASSYQFAHLVKRFILSFILISTGSFFSRKQFIIQQLYLLSNYYHIATEYLLHVFMEHLDALNQKNHLQHELYRILWEIKESGVLRADIPQTAIKNNTLSFREVQLFIEKGELKKGTGKESINNCLALPHILTALKKKWLSPVREKKLYTLLIHHIGQRKTDEIRTYHQLLFEQHREKETAVSMPRFKLAVWTFTLDYFGRSFSSHFQLRSFIIYHSEKISKRYNFSYTYFLNALIYGAMQLFPASYRSMSLFYVIQQLSRSHSHAAQPLPRHKLAPLIEQRVKHFKKSGLPDKIKTHDFLYRLEEEVNTLTHHAKDTVQLLTEVLKDCPSVDQGTANSLLHTLRSLPKEEPYKKTAPYFNAEEFNMIQPDHVPVLKQFLSGKTHLTFPLFIKVLQHRSQLSFFVMEQLKKALYNEKTRSEFLRQWVVEMSLAEHQQLLKTLFPYHEYFLCQAFKLLHRCVSPARAILFAQFFYRELLYQRSSIIPEGYWERNLQQIARHLHIPASQLLEKLRAQCLQSYSGYASCREHLLQLSAIAATASLKGLREDQLRYIKNSFPSKKPVIEKLNTAEDLKKFLENIVRLPYRDLWGLPITFPDVKTGFSAAFHSFPAWVKYSLYIIQNRYGLKHKWKYFSKRYDVRELNLFFLFFLSPKEVADNLNFKCADISKKDMELLSTFLLSNALYFKNWNVLSGDCKEQVFQSDLFTNGNVLQSVYHGLEKLYALLPQQHRPYSFKHFESYFWRVIFSMIRKKEYHAWDIIARLVNGLQKNLRTSVVHHLETIHPPFAKQPEWEALKKNNAPKITDTPPAPPEPLLPAKVVEKLMKPEQLPELPEGKWEMPHTGLVILFPFFRRLFDSLAYIDNDGNFKSEKSRAKAITLLYYLATGQHENLSEIEEEEFSFCKILCNLPVSGIVVPEVLLEREIAIAEDMLNACLMHWEKLKHSSTRSLRNTFLRRRGYVEYTDKAYQLKIEPSGTDILLDYLPWNISMIKLPWSDTIIYVSWRN